MSTEIPILYNEIRKEFDRAMANADSGVFVKKPKILPTLLRRRKEFVQIARSQNRIALEKLRGDSYELCQTYQISPMEAKDLVLYAWDIQERLSKEGAVFNDKPFNFALERIEISPDDKKLIEYISLTTMEKLRKLGQENLRGKLSFLPLNPVEEMFESLELIPNAARIDFILTNDGPKIIEINSQWVDAISALAGFQNVFGITDGYKPIETFSEMILGKRVAIIDINQSKSLSTTTGATKELESLSKKILNTRKSPINCEVIDPNKVNLKYLNQFNCYYLNCDPRYFQVEKPDWLVNIAERVKRDSATIFPNWRPLLDKKYILTLISGKGVTPTIPLTKNFQTDSDRPIVIKGDGYSLNSVTTSFDLNFNQMLEYALLEPNAYVVQPYLEGLRVNSWVYNTDKEKVRFIKDAYTKLNVWVLGDKVVGMLSTLSDSPLISDKGFNSLPIFRKENI